ncbi:hypothetical protein [Streptomyces coerulescens]|uniref:Uncharacterized protein n=1 Tax=Streptomyces coerulescens TaxID=29304 RepID=A0ABW0CVE8_STRCD
MPDHCAARDHAGRGRHGRSWLYFPDGRPLERLSVSQEGAGRCRPGDRIHLTVWHHQLGDLSLALMCTGAGLPWTR